MSVDLAYNAALGFVSGAFTVNKFGHNPDVDTGTLPEDVWAGNGTYTGFPTGPAESLQAFSSSPLDTGVLMMIGLDANYDQFTRTVTLNGTAPVTVPGGPMVRVHTANYNNATPTGFNAGTITIRHAVTQANVFISIRPGLSQSNNAAYTVPHGFKAILVNAGGFTQGTGVNPSIEGAFWTRSFGASPRLRRPFTISQSAPLSDEIFGGLALGERTDIMPRITTANSSNQEVTVKYDLIVVPNR